MKTQKNILLMMAAIWLASFSGYAAKEEFSKKMNRSFEVDKNATLVLKNKFGKINCTNWDKNSIAIEVIITVEASGEKKATEILNKIDVSISGDRREVSAITSFEENLSSGNNKIQVDFLITMPTWVNLEVDHRFGDLVIEEASGNSLIVLGYGNFRIQKLTGKEHVLDIKYSNGNVGYLTDAKLDLRYSGFDLDEAHSMTITSKFSKLKIGKIDALTIDSGYDDDFIGFVRDMDIKASFSNVEIRSLEEKLVASLDYGDLKVRETGRDFKLIDLTSKFAGTNIGIHSDASFRVVASVKLGDFSYPKQRAKLSVVELSNTSSKYEGLIGENPDTVSKVLIDARNGGVTLFYR
jgi:hypothetical protein